MTKCLYLMLLSLFVVTSCQKDSEIEPDKEDSTEYKYVRLLTADAEDNRLHLINPSTGELEEFESRYPNPYIYPTASSRYFALFHRGNNFIETFDTGFEFHGDHVDVKGTPKFGDLMGEANQPTHFKVKGNMFMSFNDGDASLTIGREPDIHNSSATFETIDTDIPAHHGTMSIFPNDNIAITHKDNSISGSLPERVKIIDPTGTTIHQSTIQTKGIHGNALNGDIAVFGSVSGILTVASDGEQNLIPYPENFGDAWFGSIYKTLDHSKFIGYTSGLGLYSINVNTSQISSILQNIDIVTAATSANKEKLFLLLYTGELIQVDLLDLSLEHKQTITSEISQDTPLKPRLQATKKFAYLSFPETGQIMQLNLSNWEEKNYISVPGQPYQFAIGGYETNESH